MSDETPDPAMQEAINRVTSRLTANRQVVVPIREAAMSLKRATTAWNQWETRMSEEDTELVLEALSDLRAEIGVLAMYAAGEMP